MALVIALLVIALGTRELFFGTLPLVGQLAPLPAWATSWHHFFSGWQSSGVGTTAPASPAFGLVGLTGTVLFGAMGTLQRVLLLGCIPLGAWGVSRCLRPLVSPRARVVAVICYLGLPLPYGALGTGPLGRVSSPMPRSPSSRWAWPGRPGVAPYAAGSPDRRWRSRPLGQVVILGAVIAAAVGLRARPSCPWSSSQRSPGWWARSSSARREPTWRVLVVAVQAVRRGARRWRCPGWWAPLLAGKGSVAIFGLPISSATRAELG